MKTIVTLEVDITVISETYVPHSAGVWSKVLSVPQAQQDASYWSTSFTGTWDTPVEPVEIGSVIVNDRILGEVGSVSELYLQDGSFYYDSAVQTLYLALADYFPIASYSSVKTGETSGFMSTAQLDDKNYPLDSYLGSVYYDPRLIEDSIDIEEEVDDQENGIFVFSDLAAAINNSDGEYDQIREKVVGNGMRIAIARISESAEEENLTGIPFKQKADATDFTVERSGVIEDVDYSDPNNPVIQGRDPRENWTQTIGVNLLLQSEFANLPDSYQNKRKPIIIGPVQGAECIPLDKPSTPTNTDFLVCEISYGAIQSTDSIYFDGTIGTTRISRELSGGEYSINLSTGILTVNNYKSGKAYFYGTVTTMTETVEMILFILDEFQNLAYISSNFNTNEINAIQEEGYTTHIYIDENGESVSDVVQTLCADIQCDMLEQGTVLTIRKQNEERPSRETVLYDEITQNPPGWVNDRTDTVKTITVGFNPDHRTGLSESYYDASQEQTALDNNLKAVDKPFSTNLTDPVQVAAIYDEYYSRFTQESRTVSIQRLIPFVARVSDFLTYKLSRQVFGEDKQVFVRALYKVIRQSRLTNIADLLYYSDRPEPYYSQGLPSFYTPAFGVPTATTSSIPYSGVPAFLDPAFFSPSMVGGSFIITNPVSVSGFVSGITQEVGE